jgi:hypothetical protein
MICVIGWSASYYKLGCLCFGIRPERLDVKGQCAYFVYVS